MADDQEEFQSASLVESQHSLDEMGIRDVRCASFHPIDSLLACSLADGRVVLLKGSDHSTLFSNWRDTRELVSENETNVKISLGWNADGTQLAAGCPDGTVVLWSYPSGDILLEIKQHLPSSPVVVWNPFNRDVLSTHLRSYVSGKSEVFFWSRANEKHLTHKLEWNSLVFSVTWISEHRIACSNGNTIDIHRIDEDASIEIVKQLKHKGFVTSVFWNENAQLLAACSRDKWIKIWSMNNDEPVYSFEVDSQFYSLTWHSIGKSRDANKSSEKSLIACGLNNGSIVVWTPLDIDSPPRYLQEHSGTVRQVVFSSDGRFLASFAEETGVIVWSTETWESIYTTSFNPYYTWLAWDSRCNKLAISDLSGEFQFLLVESVVQNE